MYLMLSSSGGCVSNIFDTPFVQHWEFSLKTEYTPDFTDQDILDPLELYGSQLMLISH